jgi:hypothetical protein
LSHLEYIVTAKPGLGECLFTADPGSFGLALCVCDTPGCNGQDALEFLVDMDIGPMRLLQFLDGSLAEFSDSVNEVMPDLVGPDGKFNKDKIPQITKDIVEEILNSADGLSEKTNVDELYGIILDYQALVSPTTAPTSNPTVTPTQHPTEPKCSDFSCPPNSEPIKWDHTCGFGAGCSVEECCRSYCFAWNGTCSPGQERRGDGDMHACSDGQCDKFDCCFSKCNVFTEDECPVGSTFKGNDSGSCYGGECSDSDCCTLTCKDFEGCNDVNLDLLPWNTCSLESGCHVDQCCGTLCSSVVSQDECPESFVLKEESCGDDCNPDRCCERDRTCKGNGFDSTKCESEGLVFKERDCDMEGEEVNCNLDQCCVHPMEELCQSKDARECSTCGYYAPCLSSIDPKCITKEALDCLPCSTEKNVEICATCAVGWDVNCIGNRQYGGNSCQESEFEYMVPFRLDGSCQINNPFASQGYRKIDVITGTLHSYCNENCSVCDEVEDLPDDFIDRVVSQECEDDEDESNDFHGIYSPSEPNIPCPSALGCGPDPCKPGVDPKCIVFTVFNSSLSCEIVEIEKYDTVGNFHAYALGDDTCRMDSSGRSFYKLNIDRKTESGVGLVGCLDSNCTLNCTTLEMERNVCVEKTWTGGLTLTANAFVEDWPMPSTESEEDSATTVPSEDGEVTTVASEDGEGTTVVSEDGEVTTVASEDGEVGTEGNLRSTTTGVAEVSSTKPDDTFDVGSMIDGEFSVGTRYSTPRKLSLLVMTLFLVNLF